MKKIQLSFSDPQLAFLRSEADRQGVSVGAVVRGMVDNYGKEQIPDWFKSFVQAMTEKENNATKDEVESPKPKYKY